MVVQSGAQSAPPPAASQSSLGVRLVLPGGFARGQRAILGPLELRLEAGRSYALLGPSGSGKTTLLRLLAGLERLPPGASCTADDGAPLSGRVAWMDQTDLLLPWASALDNVTLGARLRGERPDHHRAAALLAAMGLADRAHERPGAFSGGMRQRTALARTLYEDRPLALLDEPFAALDAITRRRLQELTAGHLRGRTSLLVTHDPAEALRMAEFVWVLRGQPAAPGHVFAAAPDLETRLWRELTP